MEFIEKYAIPLVLVVLIWVIRIFARKKINRMKRRRELNPKPKKCPKCGRKPKIHGGPEEWKPSYYDPDSGGDPYYIECECGYEFCIGHCEYHEFVNAWNKAEERSL